VTGLPAIIYGLFKALLDAWIENLKKPTVASDAAPVPARWYQRFADGMRRLKSGNR
jgi:hypothetical protein